MPAPAIYVEITIRTSLEQLWKTTQDPKLHERWDLRFTQIQYLPRNDGDPQRFLYGRRFLPGVTIRGTGETVGRREKEDGTSTSALKFWSDDRRSLIRRGAGFWRYIPTTDGVRFLTRYDYEPRWGLLGRVADRVLLRPAIGWATAWSFDRLRLWLEAGVDPTRSLNQSIVHGIARVTLGLIWLYHGVVPKLLAHDPTELELMKAAGIPPGRATTLITLFGIAEIVFGILILFLPRARWHLVVSLVVLPPFAIAAVVASPSLLTAAFNPVSLTAAMVALAFIAYRTSTDLPTATNCLRHPPLETS